MKHLQKMKGKGTITSASGEKVPAAYDIDCSQGEVPTGFLQDTDPNSTTTGTKTYEGVVRPFCFTLGETLMLEMQDGLKLTFRFRNTDGAITVIKIA
jgi:hypothetical protein